MTRNKRYTYSIKIELAADADSDVIEQWKKTLRKLVDILSYEDLIEIQNTLGHTNLFLLHNLGLSESKYDFFTISYYEEKEDK